jgi:transcriptional regulator with XRE-family HTH domain
MEMIRVELEEREIYFMKRRRLNIPMQEIADAIGVNQSSISRYERGQINLQFEQQYRDYIDNYSNRN